MFGCREEREQVDGMISMFANMEMPEYKFENKKEESKIAHKVPYDYQTVSYISK
jgi:hypothetical protein